MSSIVSNTPQRKRRSINNDSTLNSSECLDLSIREYFLVVYYSDSDPGNEYEILSEKDLDLDSWDVLERGALVCVKFGNARVQGTVVTIGDDLNSLKNNFDTIIEEHREDLAMEKLSINIKKETTNHNQLRYKNQTSIIQRPIIIKVRDKETQTDSSQEDNDSLLNNVDYSKLKKKYDELKDEFNKFTSLFSDVKNGLENTMDKLSAFKINDDSNKDSSSTSSSPSSNITTKVFKPSDDNKENIESFSKMIQIGPGGTKVPKHIFDSINWSSYTAATRKLLITLFSRKVLATHSLTGKPSPAFLSSEKQTKMKLNPSIISDVIEVISKNCKVPESLVRNAITTKCADENKLYRRRMQKRKGNDDENEAEENETKKTKKGK